MPNRLTATCTRCGATHEVPVWPLIRVGDDPSLKARVKDGSLFVWTCPRCGAANLARYQTLYHDPGARLMVWLLPSGVVSPEEQDSVERRLNDLSAQLKGGDPLDGYTLRRVDDVGSLIEKVNIFDAGLDDIVLEICKYVTRLELAEKADDPAQAAALMDAPFKFYRMEGADNEIILTFPEEGQMKAVNIGFNVYEDGRRILSRNSSVRLSGGFARVDAAWLEQFFR